MNTLNSMLKDRMIYRVCVFGFWMCGMTFAANAETIICQMGGSPYGWVTRTYTFKIDRDAGTVTVEDLLLKQFVGGAIAANLDVRGNGNIFVKWRHDDIPLTRFDYGKVDFAAFLNMAKGGQRSWVEARFPNSFFMAADRGYGTCRPQ